MIVSFDYSFQTKLVKFNRDLLSNTVDHDRLSLILFVNDCTNETIMIKI